MHTASDLLVAEIALRAKRSTEAEVGDYFTHLGAQARAGKILSLAQLLIKRHKIAAEEFLEVRRLLEEPLFACPSCAKTHSAQKLDSAGEPRCPDCGAAIDVEAAVRALPDSALALMAGGPLARRPETRASGRVLLAGSEKAKGRRFGRYEILNTVGIGAMGVVYKARQLDLDRIVALKVLREGEGAREEQVRRFIREAQAAAKLQHPNIVAIHEVGLEDGIHYFTMDFVEGETLQEKLKRDGRPPPLESARLLATIARALHYAHQHGIVHRDLKPGNIIITPEGVPKVTDFGLAKTMGTEFLLTRSGVAVGTPLYMSPEQAKGDLRGIDGRSDVFSLGVLLYQTLTGALPFSAESHLDLYNKILFEDPTAPRKLVREVPKDLQTISLKALEKQPRDRYQSAKELAEDLERVLKGEPIRARPLGPVERIVRSVKRHQTVALVAATALVVAGTGWYLTLAMLERKQAEVEAVARARALAEARSLLAEVGRALEEGRAKDAIDRAAVLYARFPDSSEADEARFLDGAANLGLGRTREALGAYARAYRRAATDRDRARALAAIADAFIVARDHDHALACLAKLIGRFGSFPEAVRADLLRGKLLAELDDPTGARRHLEAAAAGQLTPAERDDVRATLAWLDDLSPAIEIGGADAGNTGDTNGDGRPELLLVRQGTLLAIEPGPEGPIEIARAAVAGPRDAVLDLSTADVNGDGRAEAILAIRDGDEGPVLAVLGFTKADPPTFDLLFRTRLEGRVGRGGIAAGDVDGDGRDDIVIATAGGAGVRVLRSASDGTFQPIPLAADLSARGAEALAVLSADLDRDGRFEVLIGTGGSAGDGVSVYRWNTGAGGLDVEWRQKIGPVGAILAEDFDGDGAVDLAIGRSPTAPGQRRDFHFLADGLYVFRPVEPVKSYAASWHETVEPGAPAEMRVRALAAGDISATGGASLVALLEPLRRAPAGTEEDRLTRTVAVYTGFGRPSPVRRDLVYRDRPIEWVRTADLDADGDDELVAGGPSFVRIYGVRGGR